MKPTNEYWRSLEEWARSPQGEAALAAAPGADPSLWPEGLDRRRFLQLMGASFALAGLGACTRQPLEQIVPYVRQPEDQVAGKPLYYATALTFGGYATGVLVESHLGRPTKIEGNPDHPASLGSTDRFAQAAILDLYDPDRSQVVRNLDRIRTWEDAVSELQTALVAQEPLQGEGLRLLSGSTTSPTVAAQMQRIRARFPRARWHRWEPCGRDGLTSATLLALGQYTEIRYDFAAADVVVGLDSDFLASGPGSVRYAHDFMKRRRVREGQIGMNRLYAIECTPSPTGAVADHRLGLDPDRLLGFAFALALECNVHGTGALPPFREGELAHWLSAIGSELRTAAGRSLVVAGEHSPVELHALALAMNARLGNFGKTVFAVEPVEVDPVSHLGSIRDLAQDMRAGRVDLLLVLGGNPVYDAPADLEFAAALRRVKLRMHLAPYEDETSELCHWHVPQAHELETWSDARAFDGTLGLLQPLIAPLYNGKSVHELLAVVAGQEEKTSHDIVRAAWQARDGSANFDAHWQRALHDGFVPGTAAPPVRPEFQRENIIGLGRGIAADLEQRLAPAAAPALTLVFRPDPNVHDGRFANNGWLQELPKPWTKLTWDNAALIGPATAERLGLRAEDVVEIGRRETVVRAPVWVLPGQPEGAVTVHLGYGRRRSGRVGTGAGFDAGVLRTTTTLDHAPDIRLRRTRDRFGLATTQSHHGMEGRNLVRQAGLDEFRAHPDFARAGEHAADVSLYPGWEYTGIAWGMVVDLGACIGCNACVVACNAENNIPVVGKEQVARGREMHWIRVDHYYTGTPEAAGAVHQPVLCMHCENAPCEVVCPVGATVHSSEGLNQMVYNRCVGTRYCSNNCPYKVRRFNFLQYADRDTEVLKLMRNPDVTVRSRGVMEKCTYCVQRINQGHLQAKKENRAVRDGEVLTACQQVCPTDALVFGDTHDAGAQVTRLRGSPLHYALLGELNTRPRTTYLARIRNPNPQLDGAPAPQDRRRSHGR